MQRHPLDVVSLVFGLLFTAVAVLGMTDVLQLTDTDVRWLGPGLLVLIGLVLVVTAGFGRGRSERVDTGAGRDADTGDGRDQERSEDAPVTSGHAGLDADRDDT